MRPVWLPVITRGVAPWNNVFVTGELLGAPLARAVDLFRRHRFALPARVRPERQLRAVDAGLVRPALTRLLAYGLADDRPMMPPRKARSLVDVLFTLLGEPVEWYTNAEWGRRRNRYQPTGWTPFTRYTFDAGFLWTCEGSHGLVWAWDED